MDIYTLEGRDYQIIDIINLDNDKYVFFGALDKPKGICIRKLVEQDGQKYYVGLENKEECDKAYKEFSKKYKDLVLLDN